MSLTTALFTGLTGMDVHTKSLDVIGNNITNVNTIGFKGSRAIFESQLSNSLSFGTGPTANSGGTNPTQVGLGVQFSGTQRNLTNGSIQPTGVTTDLALEGAGFFMVRQFNETFYTRAGSFDLDADKRLSSTNGGIVQGFGVDSNFNIVPGIAQDMEIPLGTLTVAEATRNINFAGNLNASGAVSVNGTQYTSQALIDGATLPATGATLLTDLRDASLPATPLFATGDVIKVQNVEKGGKALGTFTFEVNNTNTTTSDAFGTTLQDYLNFLDEVLGLHNVNNGSGQTPGVIVNGAGQIIIEGNHGKINDLTIQAADITSNGNPSQPFFFDKTRDADGESVRTTFLVFDSLGTPLTLDVSIVLESKTSSGTMWRFYAESIDDTDVDLVLRDGTLEFDSFGQLVDVTNQTLQLNRTNTGAIDPLSLTLNFESNGEAVSSLTDTASTLAAILQDGSPIGTLDSFSIGQDGVIRGAFTNGLTRTLGQVAIATFSNPEGLVEIGSNLFRAGPNSGLAVPVAPLTFGAARIISGALELSNVDLSQEFVNLITTSTGFSAASRVITTSDQLIQQLLAISR